MRTYISDTAELAEDYGIQIGRWEQYGDLGTLPFGAMWCVVPPGGVSAEDVHPEVEFAIVTRGSAVYEADGDKVEVPTGGVIVLPPGQRHTIHNVSADKPLVILSLYWIPSPDDDADSG